MSKEESYVQFRGTIVTSEWYEAWLWGYKNPHAIANFYSLLEQEAAEQGQLESRRDTLMEGTF
jgi:hypothetical protein